MNKNEDFVIESYLRKKKQRPVKNKTSLRYFKLDVNEKTFSYKLTKESQEIKVIHLKKELKGFDENIDEEDKHICDFEYAFKIFTTNKIYVLYTETNEVYKKWLEALKFCFINSQIKIKNSIIMKNIKKDQISNSKIDYNNILNTEDLIDDLSDLKKKKTNLNDIKLKLTYPNGLADFYGDRILVRKNEAQKSSNVLTNSQKRAIKKNSMKEIEDSRPTSHLVEFVLNNNVKQKKQFNENDIKPQIYNSTNSRVKPKLVIQGLNESAEYVFHTNQNEYIETENNILANKDNRDDYVMPSPINQRDYKQFEDGFEDEDDAVKKLLNPVILPNSENHQPVKTFLFDKYKREESSENDEIRESLIPLGDDFLKKIDLTEQTNNKLTLEKSNGNVKWNELNDDWNNDNTKNIYDILNKNMKVDSKQINQKIVKPAVEKPLFDESNLHIKKSVDSKKIAIENLHFSSKFIENDNCITSIDGYNPNKNQSNNPRVSKAPRSTMVDDIIYKHNVKLDVSRVMKVDEELLNVKRKVVGTDTDHLGQNSFVMNLVLPEKLAVFYEEPTDQIKMRNSQILNNNYQDNSVYLGKSRDFVKLSQIQPQDNMNKTVAEMILKVPDKRSYYHDIKTTTEISGNKIREDVPHDEYHTRIMTTVKIEEKTFLGDDFHIPESVKKEQVSTQKEITTSTAIERKDSIINAKDNFDSVNLSHIVNYQYYSTLNIDEAWDTSIIFDDNEYKY
jgi:hypothetical protein